jgi:hypothetical protein
MLVLFIIFFIIFIITIIIWANYNYTCYNCECEIEVTYTNGEIDILKIDWEVRTFWNKPNYQHRLYLDKNTIYVIDDRKVDSNRYILVTQEVQSFRIINYKHF